MQFFSRSDFFLRYNPWKMLAGGCTIDRGGRRPCRAHLSGRVFRSPVLLGLLSCFLLHPSKASTGCLSNKYLGPDVGREGKIPRVVGIESNIKSPAACGEICDALSVCTYAEIDCHVSPSKRYHFFPFFSLLFFSLPLSCLLEIQFNPRSSK